MIETEFRKRSDPWIGPGCYSLDLYCDHENPDHGFDAFPHQFIGEMKKDCHKAAKKSGWKIHQDGTATCPICVKKIKELG